jgi:transcriptional regulator with XRE-family HTH domain
MRERVRGKTMKMLITPDWLRKRIENDPDIEVEAGGPAALLESLGMFIPGDLAPADERLKVAFGVVVRQLRLREELTVAELCVRADVPEEQLRSIEHDPHFKPRPRTVYQLADYFSVSKRGMMKLSGATRAFSPEFKEAAYRFAAKSDDLSKLTDEERQILNDYVKFLNDQSE